MKKKIIAVMALLALLSNTVMPTVLAVSEEIVEDSSEIEFANADLKKYLLEDYDNNQDGKLSEKEMLQVEEIDREFASEDGVDLTGLEYAKNLKILRTKNIKNAEAIKHLTKLEKLYITFKTSTSTKVKASEIIKEQTNLKELDVRGADFSGFDFSDFTQLEKISIIESGITNIDSIKNLTNLRNINFNFNEISNIKVLEDMDIKYVNINYQNIVEGPIDIPINKNVSVDLPQIFQTLRDPNSKYYIGNSSITIEDDIGAKVDDEYNAITFNSNEDGKTGQIKVKLNKIYDNGYASSIQTFIIKYKTETPYDSTTEIEFGDNDLKNYFYSNSEYDYDKDGKITALDMSKIKELTISRLSGTLKGLEYAVNLEKLTIFRTVEVEQIQDIVNLEKIKILNLKLNGYNEQTHEFEYSDISEFLNNFKSAQGLETLNLSGADITSVDFNKMQKLEELKITNTKLSNIKQLTPLKQLKKLTYNYKIDDFYNIKELTLLEEISATNSGIKDISCLDGLKNLQKIDFSFNEIEDISSLEKLTNLKTVNLRGNKIEDFSPVEKVAEITANNQNITIDDQIIYVNSSTDFNMPEILASVYDKNSRFYSDRYYYTIEVKDTSVARIEETGNGFVIKSNGKEGTTQASIKMVSKDESTETKEKNKFYNSVINFNIKVEKHDGDNTKEIEIKNNNLKQEMLSRYDFDNDEKITEYDMNQIGTLQLFLISEPEDLVIIEKAKYMYSLDLNIRDYTGKFNEFDWNKIAKIETLKTLKISGHLKKIDFLKTFTNIKNLDLSNSEIKDITPLAELNNLESLDVSNNKIKDFSVINQFDENLRDKINVKNQKIEILRGGYIYLEDSKKIDLPLIINQLSTIFNNDGILVGQKDEDVQVEYIKETNQVSIKPLKTNSMYEQRAELTISGGRLDGTKIVIYYIAVNDKIGDKDKEIEIKNGTLKRELIKLCDYNRDGKLTENEVLQLEDFSYYGRIYDWSGIENCKNIKSIRTNGVNVKGLEKLQSLERLEVYGLINTDELEKLTNLKELYISPNGKIDVEEKLAKLTKLEILSIAGDKNFELTNIEALSKLSNLKKLIINGTDIQEKLDFTQFKRIEEIDLERCDLTEAPNIEGLENLKGIQLQNNRIQNFDNLKDKTNIEVYANLQKVNKEITDNIYTLKDYVIELPQYFKDLITQGNRFYEDDKKVYSDDVEFEITKNGKIRILKNTRKRVITFYFRQAYDTQNYNADVLRVAFTGYDIYDQEVELNNPELTEELLKLYDYDNNGKLTKSEVYTIDKIIITHKNKIKNLNGIEKIKNIELIIIENGEI